MVVAYCFNLAKLELTFPRILVWESAIRPIQGGGCVMFERWKGSSSRYLLKMFVVRCGESRDAGDFQAVLSVPQ